MRAATIDVLGRAEQLGQTVIIAVRDVDPGLLDGLVESVARLPSLVGQLAAVLSGAEALIGSADEVRARAAAEVRRVEQTRTAAAFEVDAVDVTRRRAELVVGDAAVTVERINLLVDGAEALLERAGRLMGDVEVPVRRLLPTAVTLADLAEPTLPELAQDLAGRLPALLTEMTDDVVPSLAAMRDAVPDVQQLSELAQRLEPLLVDVSSTMAGLPGARRARQRGSRIHPDSSAGAGAEGQQQVHNGGEGSASSEES